MSENSPLSDLFEQKNFGIGVYKGSVVFIKRIFKKSIDLTRNVRKELIQVRKFGDVFKSISLYFFADARNASREHQLIHWRQH